MHDTLHFTLFEREITILRFTEQNRSQGEMSYRLSVLEQVGDFHEDLAPVVQEVFRGAC
jgi:hypothetical protein